MLFKLNILLSLNLSLAGRTEVPSQGNLGACGTGSFLDLNLVAPQNLTAS